jgi:hypothetical protein
MAALAVCAVTAAQEKTQAPQPILPVTPDQEPPADTGLSALTVAEITRLFTLLIRRFQVNKCCCHTRQSPLRLTSRRV